MKKIVAILLVLVMALSICACGNNETASSTQPPASSGSTSTPDKAPESDGNKDAEQDSTPVWPNGDVTILAGYATGSLTDVSIRVVADYIAEKTGANVIIENNEVGGGANLATKLVNAEPDGQTLMFIGVNNIGNYYNGIWSVNPSDDSLFKLVCGGVMPNPESGCMVLTQADAPYDTWEEFAEYCKANPGQERVASIAGKVMDTKMKALFNGTGMSEYIRWVSTTNADATAGLLGDNIDIIILDEQTAMSYLRDGSAKALINSRYSDDYSYYSVEEDKELIMSIPTLKDVFGEEGQNYMVANKSMYAVPAGTPDEICEQIAAVVNGLLDENEGEWFERKTSSGGTSTFYTWDGDEVMEEWKRLDPVIKGIVEMG